MKCTRLLPFVFFALTSLLAQSNQAVFASAVTYGSGGQFPTWPSSVAVADVNGDGKPDLLVANCSSSDNCTGSFNANGSVGVLLGNGDGTFQTAVTYASGGLSASSVRAADVNGDGKPDLLVSNYDRIPTVGVLLGNGDGTFQTAVTYRSGGDSATSLAVADVNGDGKPDLLVAHLCSSISNCSGSTTASGLVGVLLGNGDGSFQMPVSYGSGGFEAISVAVADVNGDGKPDMLVTNECATYPSCENGGIVSVLLGNGDGTFQAAVSYGSGGWVSLSVAAADVNGDGRPDLLVGNITCNSRGCPNTVGLVGVLLGNGDGTFQTALSYASGGWVAFSVAAADVNGDGKPDIVVSNECATSSTCGNGGSVGVLLGNGNGTFQTAVLHSSGGYDARPVAAADVNEDGKPDIVVANQCATSRTCAMSGELGVLINVTPSPYKASVQQPINADGSSVFSANRGVIPVKFTLTKNNVPTCTLPQATIAITRTGGGTLGPVGKGTFLTTSCQYHYNLPASSLGVGTYRLDVDINGFLVGHAVFALK
jgi:hypothetical protein